MSIKVFRQIAEMREWVTTAHRAGKTIGFVPTMGALHDGHSSLLRRAQAENDFTVMSLFVNPTQFTDIEDFEKYPRNPERDFAIAGGDGVGVIFEPTMDEMYPKGFDTVVVVRGLSDKLEGSSRPGHFQGVATVVSKLFQIVQADRAYFGMKDYQQLQVIRRMATDLNSATEVIACPTVREASGLAMSSRNVRLSIEQRKAAMILSRALSDAQEIADTGVRDAYKIRAYMQAEIEAEPMAKLNYAVIVDPEELREVDTIDAGAVALVAATFGDVRLIDNRLLAPAPGSEMRR